MNGLINKKEIMKAYVHLRQTNCTIPDETLDFMRDVSLRECERMEACNWNIPYELENDDEQIR